MAEWEAKVYQKHNVVTRGEQQAWREMRRSVLNRDKNTCRRCGKRSANGKGLSVHHIIPRIEGGVSDKSNLITLCEKCHDFVEISGFRLLADICIIDDEPLPTKPAKQIRESDDDHGIIRPDWHKYVYGGVHR